MAWNEIVMADGTSAQDYLQTLPPVFRPFAEQSIQDCLRNGCPITPLEISCRARKIRYGN